MKEQQPRRNLLRSELSEFTGGSDTRWSSTSEEMKSGSVSGASLAVEKNSGSVSGEQAVLYAVCPYSIC